MKLNPVESCSYRQIRVGRVMVGMNGLDEIFSALYAEGLEPGAGAIRELLERARGHNYIPSLSEDVFGEALLREFQEFWQRQSAGGADATHYGTWRGHPREAIPWYPTLNAGRCDGCGACMRFCPNGVFAARDGEVQLIEPYKCQVGCSACVRICKPGAISFPPKDVLQAFAR